MNFHIRQYGRTELARMYSPHVCDDAAWRKLRRWMEHSPGLMEQLEATGYCRTQRSFTPKQVKLITDAIGTPDE